MEAPPESCHTYVSHDCCRLSAFCRADDFSLRRRYGWDKSDPGGPTKYGITCYDLAEFMHEKMDRMARWAPIVNAMTLATADQIYQQKYAVQCDFNDLMAGADC